MKKPMWHKRFMEAQNLMAQATSMMRQAYFDDKNNKEFYALYAKMSSVFVDIGEQLVKNFERGHIEGWL